MLTLTLSVIVFTRETGVEIDRHSVEGQVSRLDERYLYFISDQIIHDINWNDQCKFPEHLKNLITNYKSPEKKNILITGSMGFLGPLLLDEIVQQTDENVIIYCLIRATDHQHAKQRLQQDLEKCQRINSFNWKRIHCIVGDISKENLGLTIELYNQLIEEIGFIYHNASYVHLEMPYKPLKQWNVQGTLNTLELALKSNAKFIYTSSISALPNREDLKEDSNGWVDLTSNEINQKDGYGQTKVVVEKLLKQASDLGAHIIVIRPCDICADTRTGYTNLKDFINILLRTQLELNTIVEDSNMKLYFVSVDYCAKAIVALAFNSGSQGKCFNLFGNPFDISRIYKILFDKFTNININKIKQNQWKEFLLKNLSENSRSWPLRERIASIQFINEEQEHIIGRTNERTKDFLEKQCHLPWFEITDEHFIKSIDYMIQQKFFSLENIQLNFSN
jgi:thioester reductase-like protein